MKTSLKFILNNARVVSGRAQDIILCRKCKQLDNKNNHRCQRKLRKRKIAPIAPEALIAYLKSPLFKISVRTMTEL